MRRLLDRLDKRYLKICVYASCTVLITLVAGMILYFSSGFFTNLWLLICAVLEPAVYGAVIAYLLNPMVIRVSHALKDAGWRRDDYHLRRIIGIAVCLLVLVLIVAAILLIMALVITRSIEGISIQTIRQMLDDAQGDVMRLIQNLQERAAEIGLIAPSDAGEAGGTLLNFVMGTFHDIASVSSTVVFSIIFAIYYLLDGDHVGGYLLRLLEALIGSDRTARAMGLLADADHVFSGYIRGQFIDALVVGLLTAITLTLIGVPHGPMVGLLTGMGNLIPYVGAPLGIVTTILVCLADGQAAKIVAGVVCLGLIMFIDSNVINPKLLSDNVEVHPLLVVAALIAGGAVGGLAGMLVAVPAAAFLKIQVDRWLERHEATPE